MTTDLLNATLHSLQNGLTSIPLSAAMDNTETWQQQLLHSGEPALQDIGREIGNLQSLLSSGSLNAELIGRSLNMLGSQTIQAAAHADTPLQANLRALGDVLLQAGAKLEEQPAG
ncbi:hypothetical protein [Hymenobacter sediminicola]|uniref:Uncharacterized protein n=1 Tax=Hymenobacter sediminicola TaxID=2761579 RepID=A0A7G7W5J5_9BACT|nr:hypothetical protein [Hymenobacter sediminicola]QNH61638.1 hypothetical protein H4317_15965 [Hymenobacter sediminicola]